MRNAVDLPSCWAVLGHVVAELLSFVCITEVKRREEQRGAKPFIARAPMLRSVACCRHDIEYGPRTFLVSFAIALAIKPREVAGAIVFVQVQIHPSFVTFDRFIEVRKSLLIYPCRFVQALESTS